MITIDQLLESTDLYFDPRFVTKDKDGCITIWEQKPETKDDIWVAQCSLFALRAIKLSNFADKDWTECIYEVPRKTTGKLKHIERIDDSFVDKINAIIDTVNELMGDKQPTSNPQVTHKQKGAKNE